MLFLFEGLYGFFLGHVIASIMTLAVLLYVYRQKSLLRIDLFSRSLLKDAIIFGFPMVCAELSHLVLNYADRYLIQFYLGSKSLGIYTAGYNLATYASETIAYTLSYARGPISMSILANKGRGELSKFLGTSFRYLILILIPLVFGFIAIGPDLISLLASEKYVEAHRILPYIIIAQAFYACSMTLNAGLFVSKKTHILSILLFCTCLLNVALNIVLIPRLELIGAALATLLSFIIYTGFVVYFSFKELSFKVDWKNILSYSFAATGMYLILGF
jgi:O-antigen/teichoic acid export membrane protein